MQSTGATQTGPRSDNKLGGKFSGCRQAGGGVGCRVGAHRAAAGCSAQHSQARLAPDPTRPPTETQRDRDRGRGTGSGGRWQPQGPQTQRGEGGEGPQARGRAGPGGPLTGPSVDLQILVIWSFLTLHLLGTPACCEGRGVGLQLTGHPALLQGSSPSVCPTSPDTHQARSSPRAAAPGTRSRTPGSHLWGQVRRRDGHTKRGAGHTEGERGGGHPGRG